MISREGAGVSVFLSFFFFWGGGGGGGGGGPIFPREQVY